MSADARGGTCVAVHPIAPHDHAQWLPLWDGYNAFYGRAGATALPADITQTTWQRFFDDAEPVHALVAERDGQLLGIAHCLLHRSTTRIEPVCYLQDLFTLPAARGQGVGRALIAATHAHAQQLGARRLYWQTHETNATGRALYDKVAKHLGFIVYVLET